MTTAEAIPPPRRSFPIPLSIDSTVFDRWLTAAGSKPVGKSDHPILNPLSNFLAQTIGAFQNKFLTVNKEKTEISYLSIQAAEDQGETITFALPKWATNFLTMAKEHPERDITGTNCSVILWGIIDSD